MFPDWEWNLLPYELGYNAQPSELHRAGQGAMFSKASLPPSVIPFLPPFLLSTIRHEKIALASVA